MTMRQNVIIGAALAARQGSGAMNTADYFVLALADRMAELFPSAVVYTNPQRQGAVLPAVFVTVYHSTAQQALGGAVSVEFQAEVSYLAPEPLDAGELSGALSAMIETPHELPTEIGIFELRGRSAAADAVEGRAQMLCRAGARLYVPNNDALMQNLVQGVDL